MRPVRPGASLGPTAVGMMLRTTPGVILPYHGHSGPERTFVLQGGYRDSAGGAEVWAGDFADQPAGAEHELHVLPPCDCIAAVLVHGGVYLAR
jgi:putative transcriptional regulator